MNFVNERREFFFATPVEVRAILEQKVGGLLEFAEDPVAAEYFQSKGHWPGADAAVPPAAPHTIDTPSNNS